jgi:hypothetical protein
MHRGERLMPIVPRPRWGDLSSWGLWLIVVFVMVLSPWRMDRENITFLGSIVRIQVKAGEQTLYMDTFNNPFLELPKLGDKTQITFSSEAVLVLDQTPGA